MRKGLMLSLCFVCALAALSIGAWATDPDDPNPDGLVWPMHLAGDQIPGSPAVAVGDAMTVNLVLAGDGNPDNYAIQMTSVNSGSGSYLWWDGYGGGWMPGQGPPVHDREFTLGAKFKIDQISHIPTGGPSADLLHIKPHSSGAANPAVGIVIRCKQKTNLGEVIDTGGVPHLWFCLYKCPEDSGTEQLLYDFGPVVYGQWERVYIYTCIDPTPRAVCYMDGVKVYDNTFSTGLPTYSASECAFGPLIYHGENQVGMTLDWIAANNWLVTPPAPGITTVDAAKKAAGGSGVSLSDLTVAQMLYDDEGDLFSFAAEMASRCSGIRMLVNPNTVFHLQSGEFTLNPGDKIAVTGLTCEVEGERVIRAAEVTVISTGNDLPQPLAMTNRATGGGGYGAQGAVTDDATVSPARMCVGASNLSLLTTIFGKVTYATTFGVPGSHFYIDDGSGLRDGSGNVGIKCVSAIGQDVPTLDQYVTATGVMGVRQIAGCNVRNFWAETWNPVP